MTLGKRFRPRRGISILATLLIGVSAPAAYTAFAVAGAGSAAGAPGTPVASSGRVTAQPLGQVTPRNQSPSEAASASAPSASAASKPHDLPTADPQDYAAAKDYADSHRGSKPAAASAASAPGPLALTAPSYNFAGTDLNESGCNCTPPDTHGATGNNQYGEVTNTYLHTWDLATNPPGTIFQESLNTFFGTAVGLTDPRITYDPIYNRWFISVLAFPSDANTQLYFFAVSNSPNIAGGYFSYSFNTRGIGGDLDTFYDYPMIGFDKDAWLLTFNVFNAAGNAFKGAAFIPIPKAETTNGFGWSACVSLGLFGTLAPPKVYDSNPKSYLMSAPYVGSGTGTVVHEYSVQNSSRLCFTILTEPDITVASYTTPAPAKQKGSAVMLDSLDGRFQEASTQVGDALWNVHTIGFPLPWWYQFNLGAHTVNQQGSFFESGPSNDFNPSITANSSGDVFVTWDATDPSGTGHEARVWAGGRQAADPAGTMPAANRIPIVTSGSPLTFGASSGTTRWGDYSSIFLKFNQHRAMLVNEDIINSFDWGSRIAQVQFS